MPWSAPNASEIATPGSLFRGIAFVLAPSLLGVRIADGGFDTHRPVDGPYHGPAGQSRRSRARCPPDVPLPPLRASGARKDGLATLHVCHARVQRRALRRVVRAALLAAISPAQSGRERPAHGGPDLQHRLLVRHQHELAALFGRAVALVFQPAWRRGVAPVRHAGRRARRDGGRDSRPAGRRKFGRLLSGPGPRNDAGPPAVLRDRCACCWRRRACP